MLAPPRIGLRRSGAGFTLYCVPLQSLAHAAAICSIRVVIPFRKNINWGTPVHINLHIVDF
jgi:hypothetical protein